MNVELKNDMHIIPIGDGMHIVYAPLHGAAFYVSDKAADICQSYIEGNTILETKENSLLVHNLHVLENKIVKAPEEKSINTESNLVVILSQMCNLSCSYCFAQESRSKEVLEKGKLKAAIDHIFAQKSKNKRFSFIGGGEPTVTWNLLAWAISYIRSQESCEKQCHIGITTNGTLFNQERITFIQNNNVDLNLSFEILPDVQSSQRCYANPEKKSFDVIDDLIHHLMGKGISFSFRSTITKLNVKRMAEMIEFVHKYYPSTKQVHFEPVTSIDNDKEFYDDFATHFIEALKLGKQYKVNVYCSVSRSLKNIKTRFCGGEFCLTPTGDFVACHRISSKGDPFFDLFRFATVDNGHVIIDENRKQKIESFYNIKQEDCSSCFVKWHCAGSCSMERSLYSKEMSHLKCYFFKEMAKRLLIEKLGEVKR